jgi:hypothetical protein
LREWQGLSYAEIADELGTSVAAVETLLFRARRNLASRLEHVRSGVGAFNIVSLAPFLRSFLRSGLGKLGLIGATASVALVPIVVAKVTPALANGKPDVIFGAAAPAKPAVSSPRNPAPRLRKRGVAAPANAPRARVGSNVQHGPQSLPQAADGAAGAGSASGALSATAPDETSAPGLPGVVSPPSVLEQPKLDEIGATVSSLPGAVPDATEPLTFASDTLDKLRTDLP